MNTIQDQTCPYCGAVHVTGRCPAVKAIEYHPDGTTKRVEFWGPPGMPLAYNPNPATFYSPGYP